MDLDTIRDANDRLGIEIQIMEFGQIPKQIFALPHPKRSVSILDKLCAETVLTSLNRETRMLYISPTFELHFYNICIFIG